MARVLGEISMSLDGFVAGPNDGPELGLGEGGERLHEWGVKLASWRERHGLEGGETGADDEVMEEAFATAGAIVIGRRMFDNARGWGDEPPFRMPVFVLTHERREPLEKAGTTFTFVEGVERALEEARAAAGQKDVSVGGGASALQQFMAAGLLDELRLHLVPILLGGGVRLFEGPVGPEVTFEPTRVIDSPGVTHLTYRVVR